MKERKFNRPNLLVKVRFCGDNDERNLVLYGPDRAAVAARLRARYTELVEIKEIVDYNLECEWGTRAAERAAEVARARANKQKYDYSGRNAIWGELKDFLFDLFDETCAYCECPLKPTSYGAVEHYRPKKIYDWLAYDITNYLPTCTQCNTHKGDDFPVDPTCNRATTAAALTDEKPLLLNPLVDDRLDSHITFVAMGNPHKVGPLAKGLTPRGTESVARLGLNRADLVAQRGHEMRQAQVDLLTQIMAKLKPPPVVQQVRDGMRPFSAACLKAVMAAEDAAV